MDVLESIWEQIAGSGFDQWMAWGSALIALVSFVLNWQLVRRQEKRNAAALRLAHDSDVIRWSDEVILALADAREMLVEKGVSYGEADFPARRSAKRAHLSALIDRGRLFFPNRTETDHGADKEEAFRGHRHPALHVLVAAHDLIDKAGAAPGPDKAAIDELARHRRTFVAEVFKAVDPVRRGMTLKELSA